MAITAPGSSAVSSYLSQAAEAKHSSLELPQLSRSGSSVGSYHPYPYWQQKTVVELAYF